MAKGKHISRATVESRATVQIINRETDKSFLRANHQKLPDHDIGINLTTKDKVSQITVLFGRLQNKQKGNYTYTWDRKMAVEHVKIIPGKPTTVVSLDKNQLGNASHCMMLCEIYGKGKDRHHPETLMTPPTLIRSAGKL
jgi:hypothetical protein